MRYLQGRKQCGAHLHIRGKTFLDTKMQTSFSFGNKVYMRVLGVVTDKTSLHHGLAHLFLLFSFPSVWMAQDEFNRILNRRPKRHAAWMCLLYEGLGALEEVRIEISKKRNDVFVGRKRRNGLVDVI